MLNGPSVSFCPSAINETEIIRCGRKGPRGRCQPIDSWSIGATILGLTHPPLVFRAFLLPASEGFAVG